MLLSSTLCFPGSHVAVYVLLPSLVHIRRRSLPVQGTHFFSVSIYIRLNPQGNRIEANTVDITEMVRK